MPPRDPYRPFISSYVTVFEADGTLSSLVEAGLPEPPNRLRESAENQAREMGFLIRLAQQLLRDCDMSERTAVRFVEEVIRWLQQEQQDLTLKTLDGAIKEEFARRVLYEGYVEGNLSLQASERTARRYLDGAPHKFANGRVLASESVTWKDERNAEVRGRLRREGKIPKK